LHTSCSSYNGLSGVGHDELVQFGQIVGRDALASEMANQDLVAETGVHEERVHRVLGRLHREGKRRRGEESVAQLCPIYFNIQNRLDEPKSVKLI
jgi:hypothetical protein